MDTVRESEGVVDPLGDADSLGDCVELAVIVRLAERVEVEVRSWLEEPLCVGVRDRLDDCDCVPLSVLLGVFDFDGDPL